MQVPMPHYYDRDIPRWLRQTLRYQELNNLLIKMWSWDKTLYFHGVSVAVYAENVGRNLGYTGKQLELLTLGAFFHDLGKISWPKALLYKRDLDSEDRKLISVHPILGAYLLQEEWPEAPKEVLRIVKEHHERADGSGYPDGLHMCDIHPLAVVVAAVEVYTALLEKRPYRLKWFSRNEALKELCNQKFPQNIIEILKELKIS